MTSVHADPRVPSDAELITSTRAGDEIAYGALYERHVGAAKSAARALARTRTDADDLVAEAFTRVLQAIRRGGGPEVAFRPYLLTAVRNAFYDRAKRAKREEVTDDQSDLPSLTGVDALAGEDQKLIATAFAQLPERWQLVLWHTEVEGKNPAEVAPLLGLAPNAVAALAYRAREGLRQAYLQAHLQRQVPDRCRPFADKLGAYARDGLAARDRRKVDEHLAECERCRGLLYELGEVNHSLRGVLVPLLLGVPAAHYLGLAGRARVTLRLLRPRLPTGPGLVATVAAATAGVVAVAGFAVVQMNHGSDRGASPNTTVVTVPAPTATSAATTTMTTTAPTTTTTTPAVVPPPTTAALDTSTTSPTAAATTVAVTSPNESSPSTSETTTPTTAPATPTTEVPGSAPPTTTATTAPTTTPTTTPAPTTTVAPTTTTTVPVTPGYNYDVSGAFVGPVIAGGAAGLRLDLTVSAPSGGPGQARPSAIRRAAATDPAEVRVTLPDHVGFAGIDDGWTCSLDSSVVVCTSPELDQAGNTSVLLRVTLEPEVSGTITLAYEVITPDGRHIQGTPAQATVTTLAAAGDPVYAAVDRGDLTVAGNTVLSCPDGDTECELARKGQGSRTSNDDWNMQYVDVDDNNDTFDSSRSTLDLPDGAQVLFAGLRWSGDTQAARGATDSVLVTDPHGTVTPVKGTSVAGNAFGSDRYLSMSDVTSLVAAGGAGTYTVANVATTPGAKKYGGWALVVAYRLPTAPARLLLIRDASLEDPWVVRQGEPVDVTIAGLPVVTNGRQATIGIVSFEGDLGLTNDGVTANGAPLHNDQNPADNVFNSSIVLGLGRDPSAVNNFGVDVDRFESTVPVRPDVPADQTSVTFTFSSEGDDEVYLATVVLVVDLDEAPR